MPPLSPSGNAGGCGAEASDKDETPSGPDPCPPALPDAAVAAAKSGRDRWVETDDLWVRVHRSKRNALYLPAAPKASSGALNDAPSPNALGPERWTIMEGPGGKDTAFSPVWRRESAKGAVAGLWTGFSIFRKATANDRAAPGVEGGPPSWSSAAPSPTVTPLRPDGDGAAHSGNAVGSPAPPGVVGENWGGGESTRASLGKSPTLPESGG